MKPIIGLAGRKGSGKTTTARAMAELLRGPVTFGGPPTLSGTPVEIMSFAEPIKQMCAGLAMYLRIPPDEAERLIRGDGKEDPQYYLGGGTWRKLQQLLGKELARDGLHPDMWVRIAEMKMRRHERERVTIFDDVRFPNEAEFIRSRGGVVVQIVDIDQPPPDDAHASETPLPGGLADGAFYLKKPTPPADVAKAVLDEVEWVLSLPLREES